MLEEAYRHALARAEGAGRTGRADDPDQAYDELDRATGVSAETWARVGMGTWAGEDLRRLRETTARLLEDDGVFHAPLSPLSLSSTPASGAAIPNAPTSPVRLTPWRLDPVPLVVEPDEWAWLERGLQQRARLLELVLDDLYGARRTLTSGFVPPELLWRWSGTLRPAWGAQPTGRPRLVLTGHDVGRGAEGTWQVIADRTQSPRGLGFAAENRRVVARVLPEAFRGTEVRRLSGFFDRIRAALSDLAPAGTEDPRVVVLTPGSAGDNSFDQAHLANLLGLPLVTGDDLKVDRGRVWSRDVGGDTEVDVVVRRIEEEWCDPLELRPDSRLGVPGLLSACRRGSVVMANALGSGLVESPAVTALLGDLAEPLLDEPLQLTSAPAWWCGEPRNLSHVRAHLASMVLRPVDPAHGEVVVGSALTRGGREEWDARLADEPGAWVGQEQLPLSTAPTAARLALEPRRVTMRLFAVAREGSYAVMPGGLGRVVPDALDPSTRRRDRVAVSKDVWVPAAAGAAAPVTQPRAERAVLRAVNLPLVPRALEQLYWFGRYAERAESHARLVLAISALVDENSYGGTTSGQTAIEDLLLALEQLFDEGPWSGPAAEPEHTRPAPPFSPGRTDARLRDLMVDHGRDGSLTATLDDLLECAGAVRDQLSGDVFAVLGDVERACTDLEEVGTPRLAVPRVDEEADPGAERSARRALGVQVRETASATLVGTLALTGITAENMIRDTGWQLLDAGRALERSITTLRLVHRVFGEPSPPEVEPALVRAVLITSESVVTHRRRYPGRGDLASLVELLLLDVGNPRSVAFQLRRLRTAVEALPRTTTTTRMINEVTDAVGVLGARGPETLAAVTEPEATEVGAETGRTRQDLLAVGEIVGDCLDRLAADLAAAYFRHAGPPRRLGAGLAPQAPRETGRSGRTP